MAKDKTGAGGAGDGARFDWKSILVAAPVKPYAVELTPAQGSPVNPREIAANSDVYLSLSILSFYHPEARKGLTKQVPLMFADAKWRRPTDTDLPQTAVMGPNPEAHPKMASHGNYAFGGRTFFGPVRYNGSVDVNIGLHLFKSKAAGRKLLDVARMGSKLLTQGEILVLDPAVDLAFKAVKSLLPDTQTPWVVGKMMNLATTGSATFRTGTWAMVAGGGDDPGPVFLDGGDHLLRDASGKTLQRPYFVYAIDATDTNPDRLRIGAIPNAVKRLSESHKAGQDVSDAQLGKLFQHFCGEVELSEELTLRDRDEIIADARLKFKRLMEQRAAFRFDDDAALFPAQGVSPLALSTDRQTLTDGAAATDAGASIKTALESLARPAEAAQQDEAFSGLVSELHTAVADYAAAVRSNPERYREDVRKTAKALRKHREFKALLELATAVRDGGGEIGWLNYFGAAADIEINGVPSLADLARAEAGEAVPVMAGEAFLAKAIQQAGGDPEKGIEKDFGLLSDCLGLQGRIWKQRAVGARDANDAARLAYERAYSYYTQGLAATLQSAEPDPEFHQVNLLALMSAAKKRGFALGKRADGAKWARDILRARKKTARKGVWELANAGEAALFFGRDLEAEGFFKAYFEEAKSDPFALNSTRRQLVEVWGINPKGNTALSGLVRDMAQFSMQSMATVSLTLDEIEAMAETVDGSSGQLEKMFDSPPPVRVKDVSEILKLAQSVGRVCSKTGAPAGTGFLLHGRFVHPTLANEYVFITNDHVVCDHPNENRALLSGDACILFETLDPDVIYQVSEVFWRSPVPEHDCAILRLFQQPPKLQADITPAEFLVPRFNTEVGKEEYGDSDRASRVYVVGHPAGRSLEITFEHNYIVDHELAQPNAKPTPTPVRVHYRAPTESGSSGSPVFSAYSLQLIALHHSAAPAPLKPRADTTKKYEANEGLWIQAILANVRADKGDAPAAPVSPAPAIAAAVAAVPVAVAAGMAVAPGAPPAESLTEPDETADDNIEGMIDPAMRKLESATGAVARFQKLADKPKASWAALADHPDTKHLAHLAVDPAKGAGFTLSGPVLRQALAIASTPVSPKWGRKILFGIRGALPAAAMGDEIPADFAPQAALNEIDPDHIHYRCTMGVWDLDTDQVFVCHGSTVPAVGYLWNSTHGRAPGDIGKWSNMLSPGVHSHTIGTHANESGSRQAGAFKQASKMCVMRLASEALEFRQGNVRWDTSSDASQINIHDNIHAGLVPKDAWVAKHYSAGCQVVRGKVETLQTRANPKWHWRAFRTAAGLLPDPEMTVRPAGDFPNVSCTEDGKPFTYILLTAREVRIASENLTAPALDLKYFKLRRGSQGDAVKALQSALGINTDGDFGYLTQRALIEKQLALGGEADGVVTAANAAALGLEG